MLPLLVIVLTLWVVAPEVRLKPDTTDASAAPPAAAVAFETSDACLACHNGLKAPSGEDVSIGHAWRGSMMANSARDPYWQASVRRETVDHPAAASHIEDECAVCHMPMSRARAVARQRTGQVFAHIAPAARSGTDSRFALDGVSCTLCHQISDLKLGSHESFNGRFVVGTPRNGSRSIFGPFEVDRGRTTVMHSATGFRPTEALHVQSSELCGTCHTLYTQALDPNGEVIGRLPEQMPFLEWQHSALRTERSCQSCHMPAIEDEMPIASVVGTPRKGLSRHTFRGGNFFVLRMLDRYRGELGTAALPHELETAARQTVDVLRSETASLSIGRAVMSGSAIDVEVSVRNLTGHKLPTGYPSRRAWLHVTVTDAGGRSIFESGALMPDGSIAGNDNDAAAGRYEPHYNEIRSSGEVQIYESIMGDVNGEPTTGLLSAVRYLKDNRLLPRGFDKADAHADIAVIGDAASDADFISDGDRVRYRIDAGGAKGPYRIDVELRFQPISFRWAQNLAAYSAQEPRRFVGYYRAMASVSAETLARATATIR